MKEVREYQASGPEALALTVDLLHRCRLAHPEAGSWEAADFQWWWRRPCQSDDIARTFWIDEHGPVAATLITSWVGDDSWQCDPLLVRGTASPTIETVWQRTLQIAARHNFRIVEVPVREDDTEAIELALRAGLTPASRFKIAWLDKSGRPDRTGIPDGYHLKDRAEGDEDSHPLTERNGPTVEHRLQQCSLYDPHLDLAIEHSSGQAVAYSLYWADPVTQVGLVEPVRVEDDNQRQGLASAMLREGINRLFDQGVKRVKVSYSTAEAAALYQHVGFREASSTTWYRSDTPRRTE